ncbi:MAG: hypothetical protein WA641_10525, partial [Candidatus Acidiferrales bacterium]
SKLAAQQYPRHKVDQFLTRFVTHHTILSSSLSVRLAYSDGEKKTSRSRGTRSLTIRPNAFVGYPTEPDTLRIIIGEFPIDKQ